MGRSGASSLILTGTLFLLAGSVSAQEGIFAGMQRGVESVFSSVSTTTTFASGLVTKTATTNVYPAVTFTVDTLVYPGLRLNTGGVFEVSLLSTDTNGLETNSTITRNRPFFLLRSTNPMFSPGFGYFRREERARTAGLSDVKLINEEYAAYLGWNVAGGPRSDFQFLRTHTFDAGRAFQDVIRGFGSLVSNYTYENLGAYYRGSYLTTDDQLQRADARQLSHAARVSYSGSSLEKRFLWNAAYNINYQNVRTAASGGGGEVVLPVTPFAGLSSLSDTPVTARLSQSPQLVDGNLTASAGIDLGLPAPPADSQAARNIGLDFLNPTEVNRFLIWVDRELPGEIANSFSWEVYSSSDNVTWRRETVVSSPPFGPFENRFQIDVPSITARYVKVVTRPLSVVVPDSPRFPDIFVTEMQAFLRRPAGEVSSTLTRTNNLINADARWRILDAPSLFYEGYYLFNGPNAFGTSTNTASNGVSVNHTFGRIYSAYARGALEQGTQPQGYRIAAVTSATLTIDPIPTFRSSLLYSGQTERIAGIPNSRRGFFIQNAAQPYRGIDLVFGLGWNATTRDTGEVIHDRLVNLSATVVPRQRLSLTFSYDDSTSQRSGTFVGIPRSHTRRLYAALTVDPIRTLHLVLGEEVIAVTNEQTRTTLDVGVNWAPFPDGALQFVFAHNEALRALEFGSDRSTLGAVRWNLSRRSYIDVSYQRTGSEFVLLKTDSRILSCTVRLFF